jgi:hypothetical protein
VRKKSVTRNAAESSAEGNSFTYRAAKTDVALTLRLNYGLPSLRDPSSKTGGRYVDYFWRVKTTIIHSGEDVLSKIEAIIFTLAHNDALTSGISLDCVNLPDC